jgi:2-polyprenyl-6-hydroxyphenyl methylase/3-demethylubiquinone-9 3-methyltransferase
MTSAPRDRINNRFYDALEERWYAARDDPVALRRAESRLRNPWVQAQLAQELGPGPARVLDIACGAGFLANALAGAEHAVTGVDVSAASLAVARRHDTTGTVRCLEMDAHELVFTQASFDAICAMDSLEHTERPAWIVEQAARLLRPGARQSSRAGSRAAGSSSANGSASGRGCH